MDLVGLIFVSGDSFINAKLMETSISSDIIDTISKVTVTQTFMNENDFVIDGTYRFPLKDSASVTDFTAKFGERTIEGVIMEKGEAKKQFDEAVSAGRSTSLFLQEKPDIFQISLGNIPAKETVEITISYVSQLPTDEENDQIRFVVPSIVKERYGDNRSQEFNRSGESYLSINVNILLSNTIESIESPSHKVRLTLNGNSAQVTLSDPKQKLGTYFVLIVKCLRLDEPRCFLERSETHSTFMLSLVPKFECQSIGGELIFLVDRSGSMDFLKMKQVISSLNLFIKSIPIGCYFNIYSFGSHFTKLFDTSQEYNHETMERAKRHIDQMSANYGGTEIYDCLKDALENRIKAMNCSIFLLTDGQIYNVSQVADLVRERVNEYPNQIHVFTLGIGNDVSHDLCNQVARAGNGCAEFVLESERLEKKVIRQLKRSLMTPMTDYQIDWPINTETETETETDVSEFNPSPSPSPSQGFLYDPNLKETLSVPEIKMDRLIFPDCLQTPYVIPNLYPGQRFTVYCTIPNEKCSDDSKEITISVKQDQVLRSLTVPIQKDSVNCNVIKAMADKSLLVDLSEKSSYFHKSPEAINQTLVKNEMIRTSCESRILCEHTSFIAIDSVDGKRRKDIPQRIFLRGNIPQLMNCSGALTVAGGLGISKPLFRGGSSNLNTFASPWSLGTVPALKKKKKHKTGIYDIRNITSHNTIASLQYFDGSFDLNQIISTLNIPIQSLKEVRQRFGDSCVATGLTMIWLQKNALEFFNEWELIYNKMEKYILSKHIPITEFMDVLSNLSLVKCV